MKLKYQETNDNFANIIKSEAQKAIQKLQIRRLPRHETDSALKFGAESIVETLSFRSF